MHKNILLILFAAGFFAFPGLSSLAYAEEPQIGQPAPAFTAPELNGSSFDLAALHGKVVIVHFWATWCPSCREEMAVLNNFYGQYHSRGVEVIALTIDKPRLQDQVRTMMKSYSFPAAMLDDATANGFGKPGTIPVTYVIDGKGILRARFSPEERILSEKLLADTIEPLLNQPQNRQ